MKAALSFLVGLLAGFCMFAVTNGLKIQADPARSTAFFTDVEQGAYYDAPAEAMALKGIVTGYDDGRFAPNDPVTRGQIVTILNRYDRIVIQSLREQVEKLRDLMDLGQCGDGTVQIGEECDDENNMGGDGCSDECIKEKLPDVKKEEEATEVPTVVLEEAEEETAEEEAEAEAEAEEEVIEEELDEAAYEEQDNNIFTRIHEDEEIDECKEKEQDLADTIRRGRACRVDEDCRLLVRSCGPFLTCGMPVNSANLGQVKVAVAEFVRGCPEDRQVCAQCVERDVVCILGMCRLNKPVTCTMETKVCPDGSTVSRNPLFGCTFDLCPKEAGTETP